MSDATLTVSVAHPSSIGLGSGEGIENRVVHDGCSRCVEGACEWARGCDPP